jgi:AcrR family transcriptional regulator
MYRTIYSIWDTPYDAQGKRSLPVTPGDRAQRLPAGIERAWGRRPPPRKGPKPGLDIETVVAAAVSLAQVEGLGAVSMSKVAAELGVSTMALYGYVDSKEELLALMVDDACGPPPEHPPAGVDWRVGLTVWASTLFDAYRRHPWAVRIPISGVPPTPNQVAWLETGLRCIADTGLSEQQRLSTVLLLSVFVRSEASLAVDLVEARQQTVGGSDPHNYGRMIRELIDPQRFPGVWAAAATGAFDDDAGVEGEFRFGLDRILDGIEVLLYPERRSRRAKR